MLISRDHDFVFLCNKKCASISIEVMLRRHSDIALLGPPEFRHTNYRLYSRYIAPYIEDAIDQTNLETVCLVREPLSWLYSFYRFRSRYELRNPGNPNHHKSTHGMSFAGFVRAYMQETPPPCADVGCQFEFVQDDHGRIGVDTLFLYEDIDSFVSFMSARIGRKLKISHKNLSPRKDRKLYVGALADRALKAITGLLDVKPAAAPPAAQAELPDDLLAAVREYLQTDYRLYEHAKGGSGEIPSRRPDRESGACRETRP